jgi:alkylhydroperoxidase family enzyme
MAHLPYLDPEDLPEEYRDLLDPSLASREGYVPANDSGEHVRDDDERRPRVYQALANNPALLESFRLYGSDLRTEAGLSQYHRELVILTVAHQSRSRYEWHQHVRIATAGDVTGVEVRAIADATTEPFDEPAAALVAYARAFCAREGSDETHDRLAAHFDESTVVGVSQLAGFYLGLAHVLDALGVEPRGEFVGWHPAPEG